MRFCVSQDVFVAFPGMRIVAVLARGVDNTGASDKLDAQWNRTWAAAASLRRYENSQSHPHIAPWREAFKRLGISGKKYPSSIEALLRRALKGGAPFSVNPLVDFYNSVSLAHIVPAGGFDIDGLGAVIELRFTRVGDVFQALDEEAAAPVGEGEIAYATESTILTRHLVWRQSRRALIATHTRNVLLVSEILGDLPDDLPDTVETKMINGLSRYFGVQGEPKRVDEMSPEAVW